MTTGRTLAAASVVASAPRLVVAMVEAGGGSIPTALRSSLVAVSGVATAAALVAGIAYLVPIAARRRSGPMLAGVVAAMAAEAVIQVPVILADLRRLSLAEVLGGWQVAWALLVTLAPALVAGLLLAAEDSSSPPAAGTPAAATLKGRTCDWCAAVLDSPRAKAGHQRWCKGRPA